MRRGRRQEGVGRLKTAVRIVCLLLTKSISVFGISIVGIMPAGGMYSVASDCCSLQGCSRLVLRLVICKGVCSQVSFVILCFLS